MMDAFQRAFEIVIGHEGGGYCVARFLVSFRTICLA